MYYCTQTSIPTRGLTVYNCTTVLYSCYFSFFVLLLYTYTTCGPLRGILGAFQSDLVCCIFTQTCRPPSPSGAQTACNRFIPSNVYLIIATMASCSILVAIFSYSLFVYYLFLDPDLAFRIANPQGLGLGRGVLRGGEVLRHGVTPCLYSYYCTRTVLRPLHCLYSTSDLH